MTRHDDHDREPSADERLVHGLLTTLAADHAAAQDRRVRAAMKQLERGTGVVGRIGRFGLARIAAAGALAATLALGVLLTIGPATNSAYATLQSISNRLATGNRSYRQTIVLANRDGTESLREATVDVGTGRRFVFALDVDALPSGAVGRSDGGSRPMQGPPGGRGRRGSDGHADPEHPGPGRDGAERRGPDGPHSHEHRGAPPVAWGFDGRDYWQIDLDGSITRSAEPMRMRDPMPLMGPTPTEQADDDGDDELLTLQPLLERLAIGFDLTVVVGAQARNADGSPLVVIEATPRAGTSESMSVQTADGASRDRKDDGPSIRKGRRGMRGPPPPERVRLVADGTTNELVSVVAEWPASGRFLRRMVVERVEPRASDDAWFEPERHLRTAPVPASGG